LTGDYNYLETPHVKDRVQKISKKFREKKQNSVPSSQKVHKSLAAAIGGCSRRVSVGRQDGDVSVKVSGLLFWRV
jgi:hypothetical protein